jgi:hypothetical protein
LWVMVNGEWKILFSIASCLHDLSTFWVSRLLDILVL